MKAIPFNKPFLTGKEAHYLYQAVYSGKLSGNGIFTQKCQQFFRDHFGFGKCLLTTSCTDALEMAALLLNIQSGDEVILPSYTFVSTANAFVLRGAKLIFADSYSWHPNIDAGQIESLITNKTKAIVVVHYAGVACDMAKVLEIANRYNIPVVEDAAQAIDSYYQFPDRTSKPLGTIGDLAAFSFHETKNIISGEGGMLSVNKPKYENRSEIIWEKGTNRSAFFRGEVDKYGWVDIGSSFLPSETVAAFLFAQLENLHDIQSKRRAIWQKYHNGLKSLESEGKIQRPVLPEYATNNAHMYYLICRSEKERQALIHFLKQQGVHAVFHYLSLHKSPFYKDSHDGRTLKHCDFYADHLLRLPFYYELQEEEQEYIIDQIHSFYNAQ
jgi:dTDP-4-amino-4,6-dideoxygalactose transaminase